MDIELIKRMMDACYQGKRIRDMLPPLPDGVASSYIQYLDIIEKLEKQGIQVKVSDVSDALSLPRPGVTRTVKDMGKSLHLQRTAGLLILLSQKPEKPFPKSTISSTLLSCPVM